MFLILGCGYVGEHLARALTRRGWHVVATTRSTSRAMALQRMGIEALPLASPDTLPKGLLHEVTAILDSIPLACTPTGLQAKQPCWLPRLACDLRQLQWAGYLSTTSVYGDHQGAWVDESTPCAPTSLRGRERLRAEKAWLDSGLPAEIFRLAGIYGPGRNLGMRLMQGDYTVVRWQPPHYANRIHVVDIVDALLAAIETPNPGRIVNLADDMPFPHDAYACELARKLGAPSPIVLTPQQAQQRMNMRRLDFFRDSKRVCNRRMHQELLPQLHYPSFRDAIGELHRELVAAGAFDNGSG